MNFQLKHRNLDIPQELQDMIQQKVGRFERVVPDNAYLEIQLAALPRVQGNGDKEAEVILDIPGVKPVIRFVEQGMSFIEALDLVLDRLDDELSRRKNRDGDHNDGMVVKEMEMPSEVSES